MSALTLALFAFLARRGASLTLPFNDLFERQQCTGVQVTDSTTPKAATGLHQLSHVDLPAGGLTDANSVYIHNPDAGTGTCAWSIDTGIKPDHNEYAGRVLELYDCIGAGDRFAQNNQIDHHGCVKIALPGPPDFDGNGHGTHTAGTILGTQHGVAPKAKLTGIKALSASGGGSLPDLVAAVRLAADRAEELSKDASQPCFRGTACNLSLGLGLPFSFLDLLDQNNGLRQAVDAAAAKGLFCSVAAGNSDQLASLTSPASAPDACTVGALDELNEKACFSNSGAAVDIWATGVNVLSAGISGPDSTQTYSGTSMAAPKIAGLKLALDSTCSSTSSSRKTPKQACDYIKSIGVPFEYNSFGAGLGNIGSALGVVQAPSLPLCFINDFAPARNGKRAFNGGKCQCAGW